MATTKPWVIIVGAGSSGLLLALMLGKQGVPVLVLELGETIDSRPRATHYASPAVRELRRACVADDALRRGFVPDGVCWRKLDGTVLAGLSNDVFPKDDPDLMICLPLDKLGELLLEHNDAVPWHPTPESKAYEILNISPNRVHQRLAERMRVGRILVAADAAHLCNPFGGMGLTGGIADIGSLYDCLIGIYHGKADDSILDKYDEARRRIYNQVTHPVSSANIVRLFGQDPDTAVETDEFLKICKKAEEDPEFS
ncbi:uncharacterized protein A1O5_12904 [Cladophialophora psammophila CBS 110553]|uniref:FAD-binding domain-containing protein n=1 Tax=Cladophialophora psammophila CBS 110553 TaxID=1182543 RepID=W9VH87_9EURO|nr:uncharacterized protein A1O5_12904 [Cladophialophora psammophila CBS 110553]EXJ54838.1 hypothetical protein A1O5_12904 [Cladophialophora psammophila CBS 110553]